MQIDTITAEDGASLGHYHWAAAKPRRIVVISHGMAEHAGRYDEFAAFLNAHDCEVWALDHRGHGHSVAAGKAGYFGDADGFRLVVADLMHLVDRARTAHPGLPVVLLGHSMGSFVARALLLTRPALLDGLLLSATGFRQSRLARLMSGIAGWTGRRHGMDKPSRFMGKLVFGTFNLRFLPARTPSDWLSRDPAVVDAYIADPWCGFDCAPQLWRDLFGGIVNMEHREAGGATLSSKLSVMMVAGSHDPVSMGGKGCRQLAERYIALGLRDVAVKIYPKGRHELLNETNRQEVWQDILVWLDRRFSA
ncbi:lysophospholipase [Chitinimonas arctica]|uniref:Lysophospholipase n=1 Tax=Chitinimonas arctica TaxID=2594795 RepID=A0A516SFK6_9NEIS|nr:alpha/beta hydrolase [Chitinimonas arctica]QDQ26890.1 lysophospholipase [Chitinimonas arctica]